MDRRQLDRTGGEPVLLRGLIACAAVVAGCRAGAASQQSPPIDDDVGPGDATTPDASPDRADRAPDAGASPLDASAGDAVDPPPGPQACGFSACAPGVPCPDLIVDRDDLLASIVIDTRTFQPNDCALFEGCITRPGTRRLLRFDTATANVGNADVEVGNPLQNACFSFSQCHQHYHFKGVGQYTLYQADGTTVAAVGHKQGFCLEDIEPIAWLNPQPPQPKHAFDCNDQGLHAGFEDIYPNDVDCQWIDITGLPAGQYVLSVHVNPQQYLPESNYDNNEAHVPVTIPP
jgi:hypothetical protein